VSFSSVEIDSKVVHYRFPSATAFVRAFFDRFGPFMRIAQAFEAAERASLRDRSSGSVACETLAQHWSV
jgi:hypothetical protein